MGEKGAVCMEKTASLDSIGIGLTVRVASVKGEDIMRRRLMELGFTPGAVTIPLASATSGDPTAYWIRGTVIALRAEDAANIIVATA